VHYTAPEVAPVGLYVRQARERGIPIKTYTAPMLEVDRAIANGEEDGLVKIHVRDATDMILGATVVARHPGELSTPYAGDGCRDRPQHSRRLDSRLSDPGRRDLQMAAEPYPRSSAPSLGQWLARRWIRG